MTSLEVWLFLFFSRELNSRRKATSRSSIRDAVVNRREIVSPSLIKTTNSYNTHSRQLPSPFWWRPKTKMASSNTEAIFAPIFIKHDDGKSFKEMKSIEISHIVQELESNLGKFEKDGVTIASGGDFFIRPITEDQQQNLLHVNFVLGGKIMVTRSLPKSASGSRVTIHQVPTGDTEEEIFLALQDRGYQIKSVLAKFPHQRSPWNSTVVHPVKLPLTEWSSHRDHTSPAPQDAQRGAKDLVAQVITAKKKKSAKIVELRTTIWSTAQPHHAASTVRGNTPWAPCLAQDFLKWKWPPGLQQTSKVNQFSRTAPIIQPIARPWVNQCIAQALQ